MTGQCKGSSEQLCETGLVFQLVDCLPEQGLVPLYYVPVCTLSVRELWIDQVSGLQSG